MLILSSLYLRIFSGDTGKSTQLFTTWQKDILSLDSVDCDEGIQQYIPLMISARDRYTQFKYLHRAYYIPQRLARIYPTQSNCCPKCLTDVGTFIHVVWSCSLKQRFWRDVVSEINAAGDFM